MTSKYIYIERIRFVYNFARLQNLHLLILISRCGFPQLCLYKLITSSKYGCGLPPMSPIEMYVERIRSLYSIASLPNVYLLKNW